MESWLKVTETKVGDDLWFTTKNKRMNEQQVRDFIRLRLREAGIPKEYGSNTIRHVVITKLCQSGLSLEEVNLLTDHAYGSRVVDDYYFRPEEPLQIDDELTEWRCHNKYQRYKEHACCNPGQIVWSTGKLNLYLIALKALVNTTGQYQVNNG
ncbi:MAG: hypothetical protein EZS28_011355 [Streblomastix strix]|uniref:Tyr recombinase domain-containing protein n=1 Tax=Streblomastix strix TaxID=222440 RepID=A0A5J4WEG3_9EUKA|nr:MAG: hypothetical protein EZS28_011355 [Streblomastix strix]